MEKILSFSNLYSHPGVLLEDHLIGVAELSDLFLSEKPLEIRKNLNEVCRIIALTHDIGKATKNFQDYLNADEKEKKRLKNRKETKHSLLSSVCAYYLVKELKTDEPYPFFAFFTVRRHHSDLIDVIDGVLYDEDDKEILRRQCENIDDIRFSILAERLHSAGLPLLLTKEIILRWINGFLAESLRIKKYLRKISNGTSNYIILNLLYSILLDSDKSNVVIRDVSIFKRKDALSASLVDNYKTNISFPDSPINKLREMAYHEITDSIIHPDDKIYSINLPTGLGKTLISLSFALKLREQLGTSPRIIYSLPFLSIIDQNSNVFETIIKTKGIKPDSNILLKHHYLSEIFYKKDDNEFETDEAKILIEGWNAEIIVTTFVQLFHTLISNKNKSIRKYHRFANSIIILDEVQSIPVRYWMLLRNVLLELSKLMNTYIILVTATEPLIFDRGEIKPLVKNRDFYFKSLNRVSLKPFINETMTINELAQHFALDDARSYLFIFNTITSAKDFYKLINDKIESLTYLSTHIIPKERLKRIKEIKDGRYKVIVSTQLVEAGVDIDLDVVIRDMAPLDSINQASGRCNRNGKQKGEVYIVSLKNEEGRKLATYIYDATLLDITEKILSNRKEIKESEFLQLTEEYYLKTKQFVSQDTSKNLLEAITTLKYDSEDYSEDYSNYSIERFKLIDDDYKKIDVFIELDECAHNIWQTYLSLKNVSDVFERKKLFDAIKADFYQYVISIPANVKNMPPMFGEMGYVNIGVLKDYYDNETGYITKETRHTVIC